MVWALKVFYVPLCKLNSIKIKSSKQRVENIKTQRKSNNGLSLQLGTSSVEYWRIKFLFIADKTVMLGGRTMLRETSLTSQVTILSYVVGKIISIISKKLAQKLFLRFGKFLL